MSTKEDSALAKLKTQTNLSISLDGFEPLYDQAPDGKQLGLPQLAKVAVGILTWPIAQLSKSERFKKHSVRKLITDGETTTAIEWEVLPDPNLGMPTMLSLRLLFAFCKLASEYKKQTGTRPNWLPVPSWNQLCQQLGIEATGGNRVLLKHHLNILHSTLVSSKRAFKTNSKAEGISDKFILIPSIKFKGEHDANGIPYEQTCIALAPPLLDSIENDYVKTIDLTFMAELDNVTAQLLYTKVSYLLHKALKDGREHEDFDYDWLAEGMGLTQWQEKWLAKKQLSPAFGALVKKQYIQQPEWWMDGSWKIRLRTGVRFEFGEHRQLEIRKAAVRKSRAKNEQQLQIPMTPPSPEDERQTLLLRMAMRINTGRKADVDLAVLQAHGWTLADAERRAIELKPSKK
jgi:hypothetical protein